MIQPATNFKSSLTDAEIDFRRMSDNSPIFMWMSNTTGSWFFFNKAWRAYTGQQEVENTARWFEKIHPEDREKVSARFKKHFAARSPYRAEYRLRRHDGAYRWVVSHASPYYDAQNRFGGFTSVCFDFNDQYEFENTLAARALKQTALAAYSRFALEPRKFSDLTREAVKVVLQTLHVDCAYVASLNRDDLTLALEASACRFGQVPPQDLGTVKPAALSITRAMQMADAQDDFSLSKLLAENGIRSALMCPIGVGRQLYGYIFANTRTVRTFSPEAIDFLQGLANILGTVHQRELAEAALVDSEQKLLQSQKVEAIGLLAGGIAHDFNNLLTAIRGYTDLIKENIARLPASDVSQTLRGHATGIENTALRATKLVSRLLAFSRTQAAEIERIDLNALVLDLKDLIAAFLRSGIHLDIQPGPGPVNACVDRNQIEQVILNLAINSRDAMPDGGRLTVNIASVQIAPGADDGLEPGGYAQIQVTDTGTGIPPEVQRKLFTPFFTTKPKNRGTGLGLPTCANIVKNAGGKISFVTASDKGTTFTILLPDFRGGHAAAVADGTLPPFFFEREPAPASDAAKPPQDSAGSVEPGLPLGSETIVLVEDEPAIRDVTTAILESLGYTVRAYASGEALIAQYESGADVPADASLLITDINMPGISGRHLAERIRALHATPMRVLYISGFISEAVRKSGDHFLEKAFTRDELARKVRETLDR